MQDVIPLIIFINPSETYLFVLLCLINEILKSLFKFIGTFARSIDISDTDPFVGFRKCVVVVFPHDLIFLQRIDNILRIYKLFPQRSL